VNVRLLGPARVDLLDAADYYGLDSAATNDRFLDAFGRLLVRLQLLPQSGWRPQSVPRGRQVRETLVPGFPYRVVYELIDAEIVIVAITHARARKQPWRERLP